MTAHRFLILALVFQAAAQSVMDDATFEVVSRELDADLDASDMDSGALRRLSNVTTTTAAPTPLRVVGTLQVGGLSQADAQAFIADANVAVGLKAAIASKAGASVSSSDVALDFEIGSRRLEEEVGDAGPRALQSTVNIKVTYTITFLAGTTAADAAAIASTLDAVSDAAFQSEIVSQLSTAGATSYAITVTNLGAQKVDANATPAPLTTAPPTTEAPVDSGAAQMAIASTMFALASAWVASAQL